MNISQLLSLRYPGQVGPDREISLSDFGDGTGIKITKWQVEDPMPDNATIQQWMIQYDLAFRVLGVKQQRSETYPSIQDQLDMMYNDKINNTTTWVDAISSVKLQYPIPTK